MQRKMRIQYPAATWQAATATRMATCAAPDAAIWYLVSPAEWAGD